MGTAAPTVAAPVTKVPVAAQTTQPPVSQRDTCVSKVVYATGDCTGPVQPEAENWAAPLRECFTTAHAQGKYLRYRDDHDVDGDGVPAGLTLSAYSDSSCSQRVVMPLDWDDFVIDFAHPCPNANAPTNSPVMTQVTTAPTLADTTAAPSTMTHPPLHRDTMPVTQVPAAPPSTQGTTSAVHHDDDASVWWPVVVAAVAAALCCAVAAVWVCHRRQRAERRQALVKDDLEWAAADVEGGADAGGEELGGVDATSPYERHVSEEIAS
eukprot:gene24421-18499_t